MLPRQDISAEVNKVLKLINDINWKVRKSGLDALENILQSSKFRI